MKICVFTTHGNLYYSTQLLRGIREYYESKGTAVPELILVTTQRGRSEIRHCLPNSGGIKFVFLSRIMDRKNFSKLVAFVARERPDVLHLQNIMGLFTFPFLPLARFLVKKLVFTMHNITSHEGVLVQDLAFHGLLPFFQSVIVHDEVLKKQLTKKYRIPSRKIRVIPHGNYFFYNDTPTSKGEAKKRLGLQPDEKVVLFFGIVRPYKGVEFLIEGFHALTTELGEKLKLVIAGKNFLPKGRLEGIVEDLGLWGSVKIVDEYIPIRDVKYFFEAADVVALPYMEASQSGVAQVAFAFKKPVVATSVGALPNIIDESNGRLVPPKDPEALASALGELLRDP
ncbi:MAG: glycosyltransferase, partial [Promethearchaeota archaeon]